MTRRGFGLLIALLIAVSPVSVALAGTYYAVDLFVGKDPITPDPEYIPPFAIVHPIGYDGSGGTLEVKICVEAGDEELIPPLDAAIALWNRLLPMVGNCIGCGTFENPPPPVNQINVMTVLLHELGHCALGLDHPNHREFTSNPTRWQTGECDVDSDANCGEESSFTASVNATEITSGAGTPRGDREDVHENQCPSIPSLLDPAAALDEDGIVAVTGELLADRELACLLGGACASPPNCCPACPGPLCPNVPLQVQHFSYYRRSDNNPVVVDSTVIDMNTFSRAPGNLPSGSTYAANANLAVAEDLGFPNTQSLMYSGIAGGSKFLGFVADDVNMVEMGMSGANRTAGDADDYTIVLSRVTDCSQADIGVKFAIALPSGIHGICAAARPTLSFSQTTPFHWSMTKLSNRPRIEVEINEFSPLDFSIPFYSGLRRAISRSGRGQRRSGACHSYTASSGAGGDPREKTLKQAVTDHRHLRR